MDDRNPRLIQSHWDVDDEFINLKVVTPTHTKKTTTDSSVRLLSLLQSASFNRSDMPMPMIVMNLCSVALASLVYLVWSGRILGTKQRTMPSTTPTPSPINDVNSDPVTVSSFDGKMEDFTIDSVVAITPLSQTAVTKKMEPFLIGESPNSESNVKLIRDHEGPTTSDACTEAIHCQDSSSTSRTLSVRSVQTNGTHSPPPTSSIVPHTMTNEAIIESMVEEIKVISQVFEEQGLDTKVAHEFVLQRHLSSLQEQSRRNHENERLVVELKLRSMELEMKERRHTELLQHHKMDPNQVNTYIAARRSVLEHTINVSFWLVVVMAIDQVFQSGLGSMLEPEALCDCKKYETEVTAISYFMSYWVSSESSCWVSCTMKGILCIFAVVGLRFVVGCTLLQALLVAAFFMLRKQLKVLLCFVLTIAIVSLMICAVVVYRSRSTLRKLQGRTKDSGKLLEEYLLECDHFKMGISFTMILFLCRFVFTHQGVIQTLTGSGQDWAV